MPRGCREDAASQFPQVLRASARNEKVANAAGVSPQQLAVERAANAAGEQAKGANGLF
jgi:hypothetical protein